jgi:cellulose synthase/poly-beta-1,6-N-acetylglucosamine synthase-like glycosyltransferase
LSVHSPIIGEVVKALYCQTIRRHTVEIIVVGQDRYGQVPPEVQFIATPRPVAAAVARNVGARVASGDYLLFLDSDCIAAPDFLERLHRCLQRGHRVVGGAVSLEADTYWLRCDNFLSFAPFLATAPAGERRYLPSLNLCINREIFITIGGFDESFPGAAGEDLDLSVRLRASGEKLWFTPQAIIVHRPNRSSASHVWQHLRAFGRVHVELSRRYGQQTSPHLTLGMRSWAGCIIAAAPLLALADMLKLLLTTPTLWCFWYLLPGLVWGKTAWYWGVAEGLMIMMYTKS